MAFNVGVVLSTPSLSTRIVTAVSSIVVDKGTWVKLLADPTKASKGFRPPHGECPGDPHINVDGILSFVKTKRLLPISQKWLWDIHRCDAILVEKDDILKAQLLQNSLSIPVFILDDENVTSVKEWIREKARVHVPRDKGIQRGCSYLRVLPGQSASLWTKAVVLCNAQDPPIPILPSSAIEVYHDFSFVPWPIERRTTTTLKCNDEIALAAPRSSLKTHMIPLRPTTNIVQPSLCIRITCATKRDAILFATHKNVNIASVYEYWCGYVRNVCEDGLSVEVASSQPVHAIQGLHVLMMITPDRILHGTITNTDVPIAPMSSRNKNIPCTKQLRKFLVFEPRTPSDRSVFAILQTSLLSMKRFQTITVQSWNDAVPHVEQRQNVEILLALVPVSRIEGLFPELVASQLAFVVCSDTSVRSRLDTVPEDIRNFTLPHLSWSPPSPVETKFIVPHSTHPLVCNFHMKFGIHTVLHAEIHKGYKCQGIHKIRGLLTPCSLVLFNTRYAVGTFYKFARMQEHYLVESSEKRATQMALNGNAYPNWECFIENSERNALEALYWRNPKTCASVALLLQEGFLKLPGDTVSELSVGAAILSHAVGTVSSFDKEKQVKKDGCIVWRNNAHGTSTRTFNLQLPPSSKKKPSTIASYAWSQWYELNLSPRTDKKNREHFVEQKLKSGEWRPSSDGLVCDVNWYDRNIVDLPIVVLYADEGLGLYVVDIPASIPLINRAPQFRNSAPYMLQSIGIPSDIALKTWNQFDGSGITIITKYEELACTLSVNHMKLWQWRSIARVKGTSSPLRDNKMIRSIPEDDKKAQGTTVWELGCNPAVRITWYMRPVYALFDASGKHEHAFVDEDDVPNDMSCIAKCFHFMSLKCELGGEMRVFHARPPFWSP